VKKFPIGVLLESFKTDFDAALKKAAILGVEGIQVFATKGEMSPREMTAVKRREFIKKVSDHGIKVSALCGDFGHGFGRKEKNPALIEDTKRVLDLALDLGTDIITTHIGVIPENSGHERYKIMHEACFELAKHAEKMKARFAVETGPETAVVLKEFLDSLGSKGMAVNLDPANLVMVKGDDPVRAVHTLKDYIVHTHAKDGRRLMEKDAEIIYGVLEEKLNAGDDPGADAFVELPLGQGDVDFKNYLKALDDIGYNGFLTIEREVGEDPEADIRLAVEFLRGMMG